MPKINRKSVTLKNGRPPLATPTKGSHHPETKKSAKATRTIIRAHHNLHKSRAKALIEGKHDLVAQLDTRIEQLGGLKAYQAASLTGQSKDRGGDSSSLLVSWMKEAGLIGKFSSNAPDTKFRVLEVGALSSKNAISSMIGKGIETVKRIDLKSQEPDTIQEIDFMKLPAPTDDDDKFDIISLSLVLNYVPEAEGRGEMLRRTRMFLRDTRANNNMPCLFFVLPLPCISNSRYMTVGRLHELMSSLGYQSIRMHQSAKLHYELFHFSRSEARDVPFKKIEVNAGKERNNFCIVLSG